MSRIFISHSSVNNAAALALASWLDANGWSDYFLDIDDNRGIAPGERWMAALAGAVDRCEAVIFLVSPAWRDSKYCFAEFFEAKKLGKRIFGVIVEPIPLSQLPEQMTAEWQVCDLTDAHNPVSFSVVRLPFVRETVVSFPRAGLEALAHGLQKAGLGASTFLWPPEGQPDRSPYPGLRALEEVDAAVFFGREASIVRAIDQMRLVRERDVEQLFVVLGASGAGKSSFLRAGLLPRLRRDSEHFVVLPPIRPEGAAISGSQGLLNSLKGALAAAGQPMSPAQVRAEMASIGLAGILRRIEPVVPRANRSHRLAEPTLIVPVDQAEELFDSDGQDEAQQFLAYIDTLRKHLSPTGSPSTGGGRLRVLFVLTIRSDSLPKLQGQVALQAMSPVLFSLPAMPMSEFKVVIEGPAKRHSASVKSLVITPQLTEQLVIDAQGADALPLLALTLEWLYREFTNAQGTRLGHEEYQRLGGVRGVIGMAVEHAFERPGSEPAIPAQRHAQERLLEQTFPYIATVDPDTGEWKRRVALRESMRQKLPQADALVSRLIEQRLLLADSRRMAEGAAPVEVVEVAHEALLRQWDPLERWLREFAGALSASESIRRSANDWHRSKRDQALLVHTAHRLQAAEVLLSDARLEGRFEPVDGEYLAACLERDQRELHEREEQLRRIAEQQAARAALQRRVTWGLSTAAVVVLGLLVWIIVQTREVSLQTSQVLTGAAESAVDQSQFEQSLRLGVLAAKASWLWPAHANARLVLSRAADASTLHTLFIDHTAAAKVAMLSLNGEHVLTTSKGEARMWETDTGKPVGEPMKHGEADVSASISPDGKRVVTTSGNEARIWQVDTGKPLGKPMKHDGRVYSATFSHDGRRVVTASGDYTARVWDATTGQPVSEPMTHGEQVTSATFSPDDKRVVTTSEDEARIWQADTGKPVGKPMKHGQFVGDATFSPEGERVVTTSGNEARIWEADNDNRVGEPMMHDDEVVGATFSSDSKRVVTASRDGLRIWDATTGKRMNEPIEHGKGYYFPGFSPDGRRVLKASDEKTIRIWEADTGKPVSEPMKHGQDVRHATFSPDGKRVVTTWGNEARIWEANTGKPVGEPMKHGDKVVDATFSPDGKRVVTASGDQSRVWDAGTGKPVSESMKQIDKVVFSIFSPDGKRVVTVTRGPYTGDEARIWDVDTGKPVGQPMRHRQMVDDANFSADGKRVVTGSWDMTARVWDTTTGKPLSEPMRHGQFVRHAIFSPNGNRVLTTSGKKTRVWNVFWSTLDRPENLIEAVCQRKLRGNLRRITEADVRAARILSYERVDEDVCAGVAPLSTH